jgi:RNA polymerase sigma-70 factor (ECF subfamily)
LTGAPTPELGELALMGSEKYGRMLIPQPFVVSLFFLVTDTFPDFSSPASLDVSELVARAKRGDRKAVAALYQVYAQAIFRYVACRVPTNADAEDLTAEVFLRMMKGLSAYQATGAPFEAWLYRIAASRVADYYRKASRGRQNELSETTLDQAPLPEEQILQRQTLDLLRHALRQLPEDHQTILILRFVERKSHEEVAQLLDKTVSAVKSAQYRALKRLTQLLGTDHKVRHYLRGSNHE